MGAAAHRERTCPVPAQSASRDSKFGQTSNVPGRSSGDRTGSFASRREGSVSVVYRNQTELASKGQRVDDTGCIDGVLQHEHGTTPVVCRHSEAQEEPGMSTRGVNSNDMNKGDECVNIERVWKATACSTVQPRCCCWSETRLEGQHVAPMTHKVSITWDEEGGKWVNQYRKGRLLGRGSYAKVVLYRNKETSEEVAVKTFSKSRLGRVRTSRGKTALDDVYKEVAIHRCLPPHPNILRMFEVMDDPDADKIYAVLEYAEKGHVLADSGWEGGGIGESRAREVLRGVAAALLHLHVNGIAHGDVKPDNILVSASGTVKLSDLGVSTALEPGQTHVRRSPGTPVFFAPECLTGQAFDGRKADIWALGCTFYLLVYGKYPFLGTTMEDVFQKVQNQPVHIPEHTSQTLRDLILLMLEKDPFKRITLEAVLHHPWLLQEGGSTVAEELRHSGMN